MTSAFLHEQRQVEQLQQKAAEVRDLFEHAASSIGRIEGFDATGVVHALVGEGGMPESVWIGNGWLQSLRPDALGAAVGEAFMAACERWSSAWLDAVQEAEERRGPDHDAGHGRAATNPRRPHAGRPVRDLSTVVEEIFAVTDAIDLSAAPPAEAVQGVGSTAGGKLSVTVNEMGVVSCTAEPRWAAAQSAGRLGQALDEALGGALADLRRAVAASTNTDLFQRLDDLLEDMYVILDRRAHV